MTTENTPYRYDYETLDRLLSQDHSPAELGRCLDEIMNDLVSLSGYDESYDGSILSERHHILRELRNFFWRLREQGHGHR